MKRMACLIVVLAFSSPVFAQSPSSGGDGRQTLSSGFSFPVGDPVNAVSNAVSMQPSPGVPPLARTLSLAGPRFGLSMINDETVKQLRDHDIDVR